MSIHAEAAKAIKKELKKEFPDWLFFVNSKTYSGGNSVRVSWQDGPTSDSVSKIIYKYQYGHFNGMEDIYENTNSRNDVPQVKYVFANREIAKITVEKAFEDVKKYYSHFEDIETLDQSSEKLLKHWNFWTARDFILNKLYKLDLTHGYKGELNECTE